MAACMAGSITSGSSCAVLLVCYPNTSLALNMELSLRCIVLCLGLVRANAALRTSQPEVESFDLEGMTARISPLMCACGFQQAGCDQRAENTQRLKLRQGNGRVCIMLELCTSKYMYMFVCTFVCLFVCVLVCVCVFVYECASNDDNDT